MSLKNRIMSLLAVAIGIVGFSTFTLAQDNSTAAPAPEKSGRHMKGDGHHGDHMGFGMRGGMMRMFHDLDLTDAQKTQIHSIMEANKPDQATMEEFRTLRKAKQDGTITAEQQDRLTALRAQQKEKMKSVHTQIKAVLTPEQLAKLEQRKQEMKQKWEDRKEHRQQNPPAAQDKPADE